jgi:DNA-binding CsgD family transcriptional regulator
MQDVAARLANAARFIDAATIVIEEARRLGATSTAIMLQRENGECVLAIASRDSLPASSTAEGSAVVIASRDSLPASSTAKGSAVVIVDDDQTERAGTGERATISTPLAGVEGPCGTVLYGHRDPVSPPIERELVLLAIQLSLWCTRHGVGAIPDAPVALAPRQRGIAQLAAIGMSNAAIGRELGISINTVKARLKEVFARLHVASRGELSRALARLAPLVEARPGVTRLASVTVTLRTPLCVCARGHCLMRHAARGL